MAHDGDLYAGRSGCAPSDGLEEGLSSLHALPYHGGLADVQQQLLGEQVGDRPEVGVRLTRDLLQAAYVEIARASADGMFSADGPLGFSVETVRRLRQHKFPFAGALKAVSVDGLNPSEADPKYMKLAQSRADQLDRRFEAIKNRLAGLQPDYVKAVETKGEDGPIVSTGHEFHVNAFRAV
jgi:hypothetical protein